MTGKIWQFLEIALSSAACYFIYVLLQLFNFFLYVEQSSQLCTVYL